MRYQLFTQSVGLTEQMCLSLISFYMKEFDKTKLAVIEIAGMGKELKFTLGNRFSIALLVFFIPYFLFEIPSNIILRKVGTARWLSFLAFGWGMAILGSGFAHHWTVIVGTRILIGTFESGFM